VTDACEASAKKPSPLVLQTQVLVLLLPLPGGVTLNQWPAISVQEAGQDGFQGPSLQGTTRLRAHLQVPVLPPCLAMVGSSTQVGWTSRETSARGS
jgi:hypothetical protein